MRGDLTQGPIMKTMLRFAVPMILGNLLQQCYNIADTLIVGRFLGPNALAAVGSAFTLMTFLTSILLGLCMGSGALFSIRFGQKEWDGLKEDIFTSFVLVAALTLVLNAAVFAAMNWIMVFLRVPAEIEGMLREYLTVIFYGIVATFLYNYWNCQESCSLKNTQNSLSIIVQFADCNRCNCSSHIFGILSSSP